MEKEFIRSGTHVACDTNIARLVIDGNAPWLGDFKTMAAQGVVFSLMDHAVLELINQLEMGDFTEQHYTVGMAECRSFISSNIPILPGKRELGQWCVDSPNAEELRTDKELRSAQWKLISSANLLKDNCKGVVFRDGKGHIGKVVLKQKIAFKELELERTKWIKHVDKDRPNWEARSTAERLTILAGELDEDLVCIPPLSVRLDATLRYEDHVITLRNQKARKLKPMAKKRKNDGIDYNMTYVFMKRILLCTDEKKYTAAIRSIGSCQSNWIYRPGELVDAWKNHSLTRPEWPDQVT